MRVWCDKCFYTEKGKAKAEAFMDFYEALREIKISQKARKALHQDFTGEYITKRPLLANNPQSIKKPGSQNSRR